MLEHEKRDSSSDVWSLGCVLIEVLCALTCAIEIDENWIFSEAMSEIHAELVSTSMGDEYLPLVNILIDMTSLAVSVRPKSKVVSGVSVDASYFQLSRMPSWNERAPGG